MSTLNEHGYSTQMNPKLKNLLANYKPEDVSGLTAARNKQPLWSQNTIKRMKMSGVNQSEITDEEKTQVCIFMIVVIIAFWALFNF